MPVKQPFRTCTVGPGSVKHSVNRTDSAASWSSAGVATWLSFFPGPTISARNVSRQMTTTFSGSMRLPAFQSRRVAVDIEIPGRAAGVTLAEAPRDGEGAYQPVAVA